MNTDREIRELVDRLNTLEKQYYLSQNRKNLFFREEQSLVNRIVTLMKQSYDSHAATYVKIRGQLSPTVVTDIHKLIAYVHDYRRMINDYILLADMGAGSGRDALYISKLEGVRIYAVDNSILFVKRLMETLGEEMTFCCDMRYNECIENDFFDAVRYNASILHMPMCSSGVGADEIMQEAYRILKDNGIIYISVKEGEGLVAEDTQEGLGIRCFQYYTQKMLINLLERNGFHIIEIAHTKDERRTDTVWLSAYGIVRKSR